MLSELGPDGIHNQMLQQPPSKGRSLLLAIANKSVKECSLAPSWKEATITIIPKKQLIIDPSKYRSISLTSCIGRWWRSSSLPASRSRRNNILKSYQSCFKRHRSTNANLTFQGQKSIEARHQHKSCLKVFLDVNLGIAFEPIFSSISKSILASPSTR